MPSLRDAIHHLAETFANDVLAAIRGASLEELLGTTGARGRARAGAGGSAPRSAGRPKGPPSTTQRIARRSADDIAGVSERIVEFVKASKGGLRAEHIRAELGIAKNEWMRPMELALASKKLTKKGEKRATTYFAK